MSLNNQTIIFVEKKHKYLCFYYADGHYEMKDEHIKSFMPKKKKGYKNPIHIGECRLYPTKNIHDINCQWINLQLYEEENDYLNYLIKKNCLEKYVWKMYIKYKEKHFTNVKSRFE